MLELIYETIYQHNKKPDITMYEMAELILSAQERAGMAPPEIKEYIEIPPDNILGAGFKIGHNVHKWEDENE